MLRKWVVLWLDFLYKGLSKEAERQQMLGLFYMGKHRTYGAVYKHGS